MLATYSSLIYILTRHHFTQYSHKRKPKPRSREPYLHRLKVCPQHSKGSYTMYGHLETMQRDWLFWCGFFFSIFYYIMTTSKVMSGLVPICASGHLSRLPSASPVGDQAGCQNHDPISHSLTLSWHWTKHPSPYSSDAKRQTRPQQELILKDILFTFSN